jgi:ABC-type lipoprotein release transport system permease subunit
MLNDLRYAFRSLLRAPGFAAAAIVTLAVGIGANTAIVGVIAAAFVAPLPFRRLVLGQRVGLTVAAVVIGTPLALAAARAAAALFFGVRPHDPAIMAATVAVLVVVSLAASYIPARRASRIDPALLLRSE